MNFLELSTKKWRRRNYTPTHTKQWKKIFDNVNISKNHLMILFDKWKVKNEIKVKMKLHTHTQWYLKKKVIFDYHIPPPRAPTDALPIGRILES